MPISGERNSFSNSQIKLTIQIGKSLFTKYLIEAPKNGITFGKALVIVYLEESNNT
jgi:hypothetical protein